jgi:hypothetical protein
MRTNVAALPSAADVRIRPRPQLLAGAALLAARLPASPGSATGAGDLEGGIR